MSGQWLRSDFEEDGEILYFFHGDNGEQAYLSMNSDGTIEFKGEKELVIQKVGTAKEKMTVKNAADLVI